MNHHPVVAVGARHPGLAAESHAAPELQAAVDHRSREAPALELDHGGHLGDVVAREEHVGGAAGRELILVRNKCDMSSVDNIQG